MVDIESKTMREQKNSWSSESLRNETKYQVLVQLMKQWDSITDRTVMGLAALLPYLTEGQIRGVLDRCVKAKRPYVTRKIDDNSPNNWRYIYDLTARGLVWCGWGKRRGYIDLTEGSEEECLEEEE